MKKERKYDFLRLHYLFNDPSPPGLIDARLETIKLTDIRLDSSFVTAIFSVVDFIWLVVLIFNEN